MAVSSIGYAKKVYKLEKPSIHTIHMHEVLTIIISTGIGLLSNAKYDNTKSSSIN
jgi:hypothetical protein